MEVQESKNLTRWTLDDCKKESEKNPHKLLDGDFIFKKSQDVVSPIKLFAGDVYLYCLNKISSEGQNKTVYGECFEFVSKSITALDNTVKVNLNEIARLKKIKKRTKEIREFVLAVEHAKALLDAYKTQLKSLMQSATEGSPKQKNEEVQDDKVLDLFKKANKEYLEAKKKQAEAWSSPEVVYESADMMDAVILYKDLSDDIFLDVLAGLESYKNEALDEMQKAIRIINKGSSESPDDMLCGCIGRYLHALKKYQVAMSVFKAR